MRFVLDVDRLCAWPHRLKCANTAMLKQYVGDHAETMEARRTALILGPGHPDRLLETARAIANRQAGIAIVGCEFAERSRKDRLGNCSAGCADPLGRLDNHFGSAQHLADPISSVDSRWLEAFSSDNTAALNHWPEIHARYEPVISNVLRVTEYASACSKLPTGYFAECGKLMTPLDSQPFEAERRVSFVTWLWSECNNASDTATADSILDALSPEIGGIAAAMPLPPSSPFPLTVSTYSALFGRKSTSFLRAGILAKEIEHGSSCYAFHRAVGRPAL